MLELAGDLDDEALRAIALDRSSELGLQTGDFERQRRATDQLESIAIASGDKALLRDTLCCRARAEIAFGRARFGGDDDAFYRCDRTSRSFALRADRGSPRSGARASSRRELRSGASGDGRSGTSRGTESGARRPGSDRSNACDMLSLEMAERSGGRAIVADCCWNSAGKSATWRARAMRTSMPPASTGGRSTSPRRGNTSRAAASIFERIGKLQVSRLDRRSTRDALENHVGLLDEAERFYAEALTYADRLESATFRSLCYGNFAYVALLRGDGERAFANALRALSLARDCARFAAHRDQSRAFRGRAAPTRPR